MQIKKTAAGPTINASNPAAFDFLADRLSDTDPQARKGAAIALGKMGDARAIEPLVLALSQELARDTGSCPVIVEILEALSKIPDRRALDALVKIEARMIDRDSPGCPASLPASIITYNDTIDGLVHHAVPRELHFKVLDVMKRASNELNERTEQVTARYNEYQQDVIQSEIDRIMPEMADLLQGNESSIAQQASVGTRPDDEDRSSAMREPLPAVVPADIDFDEIRRAVEMQIADCFGDDEQMWGLIRQGQYIKAYIRHMKDEKAGPGATITNIDRMRAPC
jgi:hypothetical protein